MYVGIIRGIQRRNAKIYHRTGRYSDKWQLFKSDFQSTVHSFIGVFLLWVENVPCKCLFSATLFIWSCRFVPVQSSKSSSHVRRGLPLPRLPCTSSFYCSQQGIITLIWVFTGWTDWTTCTETCGTEGIQVRQKLKDNTPLGYETAACNKRLCHGQCRRLFADCYDQALLKHQSYIISLSFVIIIINCTFASQT